jgi:SAM-dependent methyltransferase
MMNTSKGRASRSSPWLEIPLADYEGHMSLPSVGQAAMLAEQLLRLMIAYSPASVAIIGCAGGNGLECIAAGAAERVIAVDINPLYLQETAARHAARLPRLELHCADVESEELPFEPVDLLYAALIFEYVKLPQALARLRRACRSGGVLAALLQAAHAEYPPVSASPYVSLQSLAPLITLRSPHEFEWQAAAAGFTLEDSRGIELASGKRFQLLLFRAG